MNLSAPFIRRPVATTLLMLGLILFGILGYFSMPVSDLPPVDFPTIQVSASLQGASPETMASAVATPLEQEFSSIAGIDAITSSSSSGTTQITIQFALDRAIDAAAQDVQTAISHAAKHLPAGMKSLPSFKKVNPAQQAILLIALSSDVLPLSQLNQYAETRLAQQLSMINGVAQVDVHGAQKYAVRIEVDPEKLASHNLGLEDIVKTIQQANVNLATGNLDGNKVNLPIQVAGQLYNASQFRPVIVSYRNGAPLRLESIAQVIDGVENNQVATWYNDHHAIVLAIQRQPGTNTIEVVNAIKKVLPQFVKQLPASVKLTLFYDRSSSIKASVNEVLVNLIIAGLLVVGVIFLFLRTLTATLIPAIVLPLALLGTFALMAFFNFSIDNISLLGLTLAIGFFIDDAIVMLENIIRHLEAGKPILAACYQGSQQVGFTLISMTMSLLGAFIPMVFMPGLIGRLFHEFALTLCFAIVVSSFIAISLTPMLCSLCLKPGRLAQKTLGQKGIRRFESLYQYVYEKYQSSLLKVLQHPRKVLASFFASLFLVAGLFISIPKGFLPNEDAGMLFVTTEAAFGTAFEQMLHYQSQVAAMVRQNPAVDSLISVVGGSGAAAVNSGRLFVLLKPFSQRPAIEKITQQLQQQLKTLVGVKSYVQGTPAIRIGGRNAKSQYQYTLQSTNLNMLYQWTQLLATKFQSLQPLQNITSDLQLTSPQLKLNIDRDKASSLGVSMEQIETLLANALGAQQISTIYGSDDQYAVMLAVKPQYQQQPTDLSRLYIHANDGLMVPLSALAHYSMGVGPLTINHQNAMPAATIAFDLKPGYTLSDAVTAINHLVQPLHMPVDISAGFKGNAQMFQQSQQGLTQLLLIAIVFIYIVLGMLYESFWHPLTILSGLPAAGIGALIFLWLSGVGLDIYGFIGIIMLIGIVKKNAIMIIDFALVAERQQQKSAEIAIYEACLVRFRPIMMTTLVAFMATLPVLFAHGIGASSRRPLGLAVAGGLLTSQFITLYLTPIIYLYLDKCQQRLKLNLPTLNPAPK